MRQSSILRVVFIIVLLYGFAGVHAQTTTDITRFDLELHVRYLASDELEGRASGTEGNRKAAEYIARHFEKFGLSPAGTNGYFQPFDFVASVQLGEGNSLELVQEGRKTSPLIPDVDFRPLGFSASTTVHAALVFAGYGLSVPDASYDDYAGLDVEGKIVVVMRYSPEGNDPHGTLSRQSSLRNKARIAREKGAAGFILINGPIDDEEDAIPRLTYDQSFSTSGIPAVAMKRSHVQELLAHAGKDLREVQEQINTTKTPQSFPLGASAVLTTRVEKITSQTSNIIGFLEGSIRKDEVLVIGAHMDHLGYGGAGSLSPDTVAIHNGADDNASGTAALLEIAEAFGARKGAFARSIMFIAFSAEELGLLGAAHYVNNPFIPLSQKVAMLNMDMVGRLRENTLTVHGTGTSSAWEDLLRQHNMSATSGENFTLEYVSDGFGPSDHAQFYGKDIPVLFFFTGTHSDYHRPSDDWEKLNYEGHERVTRFVQGIAWDILNRNERPDFTQVKSSSPMASGGGDGRGFVVTLGVIPDYAEGDKGMKIGGIRPQGPAEKAGIQSGDVITKMAGKKVLNIYDYMGILGELKVGQEVEVLIRRSGKDMTFKVVMEKRQ